MRSGFRPLLLGVLALTVGVFPARLATQEAPDTIVLKGATRRAVTFVHVTHSQAAECVVCHHESKPEKPATSDTDKCGSCHPEVAEAPMTTNLRDAFHDRTARQGVCVECHLKATAEGKTAPARCVDCHKVEKS